jgi:hypothetical protein
MYSRLLLKEVHKPLTIQVQFKHSQHQYPVFTPLRHGELEVAKEEIVMVKPAKEGILRVM